MYVFINHQDMNEALCRDISALSQEKTMFAKKQRDNKKRNKLCRMNMTHLLSLYILLLCRYKQKHKILIVLHD